MSRSPVGPNKFRDAKIAENGTGRPLHPLADPCAPWPTLAAPIGYAACALHVHRACMRVHAQMDRQVPLVITPSTQDQER